MDVETARLASEHHTPLRADVVAMSARNDKRLQRDRSRIKNQDEKVQKKQKKQAVRIFES